jgi:hypothetical protein
VIKTVINLAVIRDFFFFSRFFHGTRRQERWWQGCRSAKKSSSKNAFKNQSSYRYEGLPVDNVIPSLV